MLTLNSSKMLLEIIIALSVIMGFVYRLAKMENAIYFKIDNVDDYSRENVIKINSQLELINYKIDDLTKKFHQIDRALRDNDITLKVRKDDK
jgi:hypothetical protein